MVINEVGKSTAQKNHYTIPKHIPIEVDRYALDHSTKDALFRS